MFRRKDKHTTNGKTDQLCKSVVPSDFRVEFNRVISQIHSKRFITDQEDVHEELAGALGRLRRVEKPREMEVVCVKNAIRKGEPIPAGMGLHFGSILGYSTDQASYRRVDIGEGRSDFAEMKRRLEQNLNQSCRFKEHAKIERAETKLGDAVDSNSDSDSARGRSASSSGSCHSPGGSLCGSGSDCEAEQQLDQNELDEFMLDKFAHECKISLSTASVPIKPTVIEIDTPLKENLRNEEFIEAQNDILAVESAEVSQPQEASCPSTGQGAENIYEDVVDLKTRQEAAQASAVSDWLARRGIVLEDYDRPKVIQTTAVNEPQMEEEIKVVKRRFIKHDPKSRRRLEPVFSTSTDSQYSSDESTGAVKNPDPHGECSASEVSDASESRDTVILGGGDLQLGMELAEGNGMPATVKVSASISSRDECPETSALTPVTGPPTEPVQSPHVVQRGDEVVPVRSSPAPRPKKSFKAIRASYDRHAAVEEELLEMLPNVRRLASKFHFEGDAVDWKNKYHSLTGRSLPKEFRQKQLQAKPSLPRTAHFEDASATIDRRPPPRPPKLVKIQEAPTESVAQTPPPRPLEQASATKHREIQTQTSDEVGGKKKKKRSKSDSRKGFFDREILARLSKFQQFI